MFETNMKTKKTIITNHKGLKKVIYKKVKNKLSVNIKYMFELFFITECT